jgi:hypothetical protein
MYSESDSYYSLSARMYYSVLEVIKLEREKYITPNIMGESQAGLFWSADDVDYGQQDFLKLATVRLG